MIKLRGLIDFPSTMNIVIFTKITAQEPDDLCHTAVVNQSASQLGSRGAPNTRRWWADSWLQLYEGTIDLRFGC